MNAARFDYHIHESYSEDAQYSTVERYILEAEKKGIEEIAFTTHFIITGPYTNYGPQPSQIPEYIDNIHRLDETTDVRLKVGLEVDYFSEKERELKALIDEYNFDFILGGVHYIRNYDIAGRSDTPLFFSGRSVLEATSEYFSVWKDAIESGIFDVMSHPDYWKRFLYLVRPEPAAFSEYGRVNEAIDSLLSYNVGIEVNSSGRRHKQGAQYPAREFLEAVHSAGLKKVTIGSDSHLPEQLGFWLPEAVELLKDVGFKYISSFTDRKCYSNPIETVVRTMKNQ